MPQNRLKSKLRKCHSIAFRNLKSAVGLVRSKALARDLGVEEDVPPPEEHRPSFDKSLNWFQSCWRLSANTIRSNGIVKGKRISHSFRIVATMGMASIVTLVACKRSDYRQRADLETNFLIQEKAAVAGFEAPRSIDIDHRSRMFDPFDPDREPMPEDDPISNQYLQVLDNKKHYPLWSVNGQTNTVENPKWTEYLPLDERGVLVLNSEDALQLALLHSTDYQQNIETLYLSALDVSSERFLFDTQFFGGSSADFNLTGTDIGSDGSTVNFNNGGGFQKQFATGSTLLVNIANQLTWQLSGPDQRTATSLLNFAFVQPLLRQAGRDVVLETLTLAERTLLANIRAFDRFRRGFALEISIGRNGEPGPSRVGGLFGGAGLQGFTGLGGGFGGVGGGLGGFAGVGGGGIGVPNAGGFLGLLQDQLEIRNLEENVARNREILIRFEETLRELLTTIPESQDTIPSQQLQVAQSRQALITAQSNLLNSKAQYEQALDLFKQDLGLPPYVCVEISDPMLDQFNLISPNLQNRRNDVADLRDSLGETNSAILNASVIKRDADFSDRYRAIEIGSEILQLIRDVRSKSEGIEDIRLTIENTDLPEIRADIAKLKESTLIREKQLNRLAGIYSAEKDTICSLLPIDDVDPSVFDTTGLDELPAELGKELERLETKIAGYETEVKELLADLDAFQSMDDPRKDFEQVKEKVILRAQNLLATLGEDVLALQVLQARARTESVILPEIDLTPRQAIDIARVNRLDWMNARASLVDSWRAIEIVADQLESDLDFTFSGGLTDTDTRPFAFDDLATNLQVGLQWDAPLNRLAERNNYRQVLIEYQQSRRNFYQFEDSIWLTLRAQLRNIRFNQINFELQRYAVRVAAEQITLNEDLRQIRESQNQASGPTAARDSVSALADLLQAQNTFLGVWVFYEVQRRNLDQDLGTSRLDPSGAWLDPGDITLENIFGSGSIRSPLNIEEFPVNAEVNGFDEATEIFDEYGSTSVQPRDVFPTDVVGVTSLPADIRREVDAIAQAVAEQKLGNSVEPAEPLVLEAKANVTSKSR